MEDGGVYPLQIPYICKMKTILAVRDGKVVEITDEERQDSKSIHESSKGVFRIGKTSGIKWGRHQGDQKKRIAYDKQGRKRIYREVKKTKMFISKK